MDFFDEINGLQYLFLIKIEEPAENELLVSVKEATVSGQKENLIVGDVSLGSTRSIDFEGPGKEYQFYFETYISYCIVNESYSVIMDNEKRIGRLFCIYSKSGFLDYVCSNTVAEHVVSGVFKHYRINCLNHTIDIISLDEPLLTQI